MADSPVFERACEELERRTSLERLAVRGTVRLALKAAGLEPGGVDASQMRVVLEKVLPDELGTRGIADAAGVCAQVARAIDEARLEGGPDRAGAAEATISRFGS